MGKKTKKKWVGKLAFSLAMIVPPWNIFWWMIGLFHYYLFGVYKKDERGYIWYYGVIYAPIYWPIEFYVIYLRKKEQKRNKLKEKQMHEVLSWIVSKFSCEGISIVDSGLFFDRCAIVAEPAPDQIEAYGNIYAEAIRHFPSITPEEICRNASPHEPLDKEWAEKFGFSEYFAKNFFAQCVDCGRKLFTKDFYWVDSEENKRPIRGGQKTRLLLEDGSLKEFDGYICKKCLGKYKYKQMTF